MGLSDCPKPGIDSDFFHHLLVHGVLPEEFSFLLFLVQILL